MEDEATRRCSRPDGYNRLVERRRVRSEVVFQQKEVTGEKEERERERERDNLLLGNIISLPSLPRSSLSSLLASPRDGNCFRREKRQEEENLPLSRSLHFSLPLVERAGEREGGAGEKEREGEREREREGGEREREREREGG